MIRLSCRALADVSKVYAEYGNASLKASAVLSRSKIEVLISPRFQARSLPLSLKEAKRTGSGMRKSMA
jgi:hypothetical protein